MHRQLQVSPNRSYCFLLGRIGLAADLWWLPAVKQICMHMPPCLQNLLPAASSMHLLCWLLQPFVWSISTSAWLEGAHVNVACATAMQSAQSCSALSGRSCSPVFDTCHRMNIWVMQLLTKI